MNKKDPPKCAIPHFENRCICTIRKTKSVICTESTHVLNIFKYCVFLSKVLVILFPWFMVSFYWMSRFCFSSFYLLRQHCLTASYAAKKFATEMLAVRMLARRMPAVPLDAALRRSSAAARPCNGAVMTQPWASSALSREGLLFLL